MDNFFSIYPRKNTPVKIVKNDIYVPELVDKFMLAFDYIDKKKKKITEITSRTDDYKYFTVPAPIGWYMSEKFDGQRALWDGEKFVTRGNSFSLPRVYPYVPKWFIALMPPGIALDGEFYISRNSFQDLGFLKSKIKKDEDIPFLDKKWVNIIYQVFDTPAPYGELPFEERMEKLSEIIYSRTKIWNIKKTNKCPMVMTKQIKITSEEQINNFYTDIVSQGAEGVMIRAPKIKYIPKRTRLMLKLKPEEEAECKVIGYKDGELKYKGMLGSFHCEMIPSGKTFYLSGMNDSLRKNYLKEVPLGTIITYKYSFLTNEGIPRHPRFKNVRWEFN